MQGRLASYLPVTCLLLATARIRARPSYGDGRGPFANCHVGRGGAATFEYSFAQRTHGKRRRETTKCAETRYEQCTECKLGSTSGFGYFGFRGNGNCRFRYEASYFLAYNSSYGLRCHEGSSNSGTSHRGCSPSMKRVV
jgi:hypothetical protein